MDNIKRAWEENSQADFSLLEFLYHLDDKQISELIKPAGFYNIKTARLKHLLNWLKNYEFDPKAFERKDTKTLRQELLDIKGIGKETADSILLYALERPVFVVDAYTKRLLKRIFNLKLENYDQIQNLFHQTYPPDTRLYQELHGLIVEHAKLLCKAKPLCTRCLISSCGYRIISNDDQ
ncbi:endonuclease III domain-containing protein [Fervidobacterium thailandense]|uniref:endonuclease III domain-containing protein n=1 Tax=Fervidobacterium thailandense TaxID=1008305 RepID=UPI0030C7169E